MLIEPIMIWLRLRQLNAANPAKRVRAAEKLGNMRNPRAVTQLVEALSKSTDKQLLATLSLAIIKINSPHSIQPLLEVIKMTDDDAKLGAAFTTLTGMGYEDEAFSSYEQVIQGDPSERTWFNKGVMLKIQGRSHEAIVCFDKALAVNPRAERVWLYKALELDKIGRAADAKACYESILQFNPKSAAAWTNKALIFVHSGCPHEAFECINRALEANKSDAEIWYIKGNVLYELGRGEEGIACYWGAVDEDPTHALAWLNLGIELFKRKRYPSDEKNAKKAFKAAAALGETKAQ